MVRVSDASNFCTHEGGRITSSRIFFIRDNAVLLQCLDVTRWGGSCSGSNGVVAFLFLQCFG